MRKKILIIEDDIDTAKILGLKLKASGYEILFAQDPISGLASAHKLNPDLIILDLIMPAGGGVFFLENATISTNTFMIPIIITSATQDDGLIKKVTDKGLVFIQKPYNLDDLVTKVKSII